MSLLSNAIKVFLMTWIRSLPLTVPVIITMFLQAVACVCVCLCGLWLFGLVHTSLPFLLFLLNERHWKEVSAWSYLTRAEMQCESVREPEWCV